LFLVLYESWLRGCAFLTWSEAGRESSQYPTGSNAIVIFLACVAAIRIAIYMAYRLPCYVSRVIVVLSAVKLRGILFVFINVLIIRRQLKEVVIKDR
jgi:hypothetical protein